jgi:DNA-binding NtrC family response regulator
VLVVDDDETVGRFMRELLETWGLQAMYLHQPEAACELIRAEPSRFNVLITDHSMPKISGTELAQRIRQFHAELPIVLYSGHGDVVASDEAGTAGLSAILRKPIDPEELARTLARCLAFGSAQ